MTRPISSEQSEAVNDHLDQPQEDVGEDRDVAGDLLGHCSVGSESVAEIADDNAGHHCDGNPGGEFVPFHRRGPLSLLERVLRVKTIFAGPPCNGVTQPYESFFCTLCANAVRMYEF